MKHVIRHNLDIDAARNVARQALESYAARLAEYSPRVTWPRDNRAQVGFSVKGVSLSGTVDVTPSSYELDLDVPFLLRMFKKKAISVIDREINVWLTKAKNGELE